MAGGDGGSSAALYQRSGSLQIHAEVGGGAAAVASLIYFFLCLCLFIFIAANPTSLRLLVFSNEEVLAVSVRVDDNLGHWITCEHRYGPLYTATVDLQLEAYDPQISEKDFVKNLQVG